MFWSVLPDWLVSSPGGLFLWAGAGVFFSRAWGGKLGLLFFNLACFGLFLFKRIILFFFLEFFFKFKFILLQNFRGKKANGFKKKFNYTLRFTKKEEENK